MGKDHPRQYNVNTKHPDPETNRSRGTSLEQSSVGVNWNWMAWRKIQTSDFDTDNAILLLIMHNLA